MESLINKSYKSYDSLSRYAAFAYYYNEKDNKYIYETTSHLEDDIPYGICEVMVGDTYDSIALEFYNNPTYYWVICDFNKISNPFEEPIPGQILKIPVISSIEFK